MLISKCVPIETKPGIIIIIGYNKIQNSERKSQENKALFWYRVPGWIVLAILSVILLNQQ